ncbi:ribosomal protection-like ABC-F family protein [Actinomadura macrotermitis]|uniref:Putative ABC transporter ATP-binding protein YbiT n=1 Tax=Actinomadura macrotermitis TaxID=2585200 RepID=A0A7K0BSE4_9ACTN|nr:ABC-F type ribosomal protection protein [Actinomadura macrotermitis]MQY03802.1 putative ABC transporter ATP-binding protein YbiT [Actinomadura macrotermitis]
MRTAHIQLSDVTKHYGDHVVLDQVSFTVKAGEKVGVIGENGAGKTTLLRLMAGLESPDNGTVAVTAPGGVGHLAQTLDLPAGATVADAIDHVLAGLRDLEARIHRAEAALAGASPADLAAYGDLLAEFEARGGYTADTRVDLALHGLGLPALDRARPLATLSGGERSRLALAATLASAPELLLLDEPGNDLDDDAIAWLEEHLRTHPGTVVMTTHDRVFLDRVTSTVLEVDHDRRKVARYGNGYAGYLAAKAADRARRLQEHEAWKADLARQERLAATNSVRLTAIPRKLPRGFSGAGAFRARSRAHGAMSRIRNARENVRRLTDDPALRPPDPLRFMADMDTASESPVALELTGVRLGDRVHVPSLRLAHGERLLVTGPNGAGKTTLLDIIAGTLRPDHGTVVRPAAIGYLRQEEPLLHPDRPVLRAFAEGRPGEQEEHAETLLALGLFHPSDLTKPVGTLSTGQRRRIALARLVTAPADLLLLDEPTNHLAPALVEELEEALHAYTGTVVIVTHDRGLRAAFEGTHLTLPAAAVHHQAA